MNLNTLEFDDIKKGIKKLKTNSSATVRRVGEALEDILRAVEEDGRDAETVMTEIGDALDAAD